MGYIRKLDANVDIQAFPGANFEIVGDVPAPQCSDHRIEGEHGQCQEFFHTFTDAGAFAGFDLFGKTLHITAPPEGVGDYLIEDNTDDTLFTFDFFNHTSNDNVYFITDGGALILTRNVPSFAQFIHAAGWAYTIKAGKLYTNMPSGLLKDACSLIYDPLT